MESLPRARATSRAATSTRRDFRDEFRHVPSCVTYFSKPADRLCPFRQRSGRREFTPMPPASNDSQGLKIAVAAFVSLTVILAVTSYFLYSNYSRTYEQLTAAESKAATSQKAASDALLQYEEFRKRIGTRGEDYEAAKAEIAAEQKKVDDDLNTLIGQANEAITKIQAA